ncbi:MAG TPA: alpha/beta fold hydrolase [Steroidobacteraceae bacterium]|nr:alpha/beta fold hydrolase [Steroidobacteraceae bacterium]
MSRALRALLASGLLGGCLAAGPVRAAPATLPLTPCQITHPLRLTVVAADCGVLEVAENPAAPAGRRLGLHVARVAAINRRKQADALFVLAGGPGQGAADFYASVAPALARIRRDRDIVLLDQRGTGASHALRCPGEESQLYQGSEAEVTAFAQRCLESLRGQADPAFYTTSLAVADLERVRAALGYERIDLYGASYGTRVAQQYLRRFPARVRALILDGVVPPQRAIGPQVALDAESALRRILARCASEASCRARFGDPLHDYDTVRAALATQAITVTVPDPASAAARQVDVDREHLATVLRLGAYSADYAALLPLFLRAGAQGDYGPLAAQFLFLERSYESIAIGMHNSVVCTEDVPFWDARSIDRTALAATFMGTSEVDALAELCRLWPRGPIDADLHQALHSAVPALLLSGGDDPVTPPAYAREAAATLTQALQLQLPGFGHGQLTAPCMDRVLAQFLERGSSAGLDSSCLRRAAPTPFFTSVNGPPP